MEPGKHNIYITVREMVQFSYIVTPVCITNSAISRLMAVDRDYSTNALYLHKKLFGFRVRKIYVTLNIVNRFLKP